MPKTLETRSKDHADASRVINYLATNRDYLLPFKGMLRSLIDHGIAFVAEGQTRLGGKVDGKLLTLPRGTSTCLKELLSLRLDPEVDKQTQLRAIDEELEAQNVSPGNLTVHLQGLTDTADRLIKMVSTDESFASDQSRVEAVHCLADLLGHVMLVHLELLRFADATVEARIDWANNWIWKTQELEQLCYPEFIFANKKHYMH